jgi:hypothetical protein
MFALKDVKNFRVFGSPAPGDVQEGHVDRKIFDAGTDAELILHRFVDASPAQDVCCDSGFLTIIRGLDRALSNLD